MSAVTPAVMPKTRPQPQPRQHPQPRPRATGESDRRQLLLAAIRAQGGEWTTRDAAMFFRRALPEHVWDSTVRRDLRALADAGLLDVHGDDVRRRRYTLRTPGGDA